MVSVCRVPTFGFVFSEKYKKPPSAAKGREHEASAVPPDFSENAFGTLKFLPLTGLSVPCYFVSQRPLQSERRIATDDLLSAQANLSVTPLFSE